MNSDECDYGTMQDYIASESVLSRKHFLCLYIILYFRVRIRKHEYARGNIPSILLSNGSRSDPYKSRPLFPNFIAHVERLHASV
jgi:hypothetical protein